MEKDYKKYIKDRKFNSETNQIELWLYNLPQDDSLFDVIRNLPFKGVNVLVFDDIINLAYQNINDSFTFPKCIFQKDINFRFCSFEKAISFTKCTFKDNISFGGSTFKDTFHFTHNEVIKDTDFWNVTFNKMVVFSETKFEGNENNFYGVTFMDNVFAKKIEVSKKIDFSNSRFEQNVYFPQIKTEDFNFRNVLVSESNSTYDMNINRISKQGIDFSGSEFKKADFSETKLKKNVRFHSCKFHKNVNFYNTTFEKLADFYLSEFYDAQQFHLTDFFDRAIFSNATFHKEIQFVYCRTHKDSYINFESAKFHNSLDISRSNFGNNTNFWNIEIKDNNILENPNESKYVNDFGEHSKAPSVYGQIRESYRIIKNTFYKEDNRIEGLDFYKKEMAIYERELKHKIKDIPKNKNSKISYNEVGFIVITFVFFSLYSFFHQIKWFYWIFISSFLLFIASSIKRQKITRENTYKTFKKNKLIYGTFSLILFGAILSFFVMFYFFPTTGHLITRIIYFTIFSLFIVLFSYFNGDRIILFLNKHSNNFGTSWVNGIVFIFWTGIATYSGILMTLEDSLTYNFFDLNAWNNTLKHFLEVINVIRWINIKPFNIELSGLSYLFLFIGRIFIGYGYYQTIQAFRKYGKS
ncbi:pentapeptide repeat-containing protein [Capnocytophaga cynodegmi]|uniref:Pentapeptide repeat-containing protein n=1 Tax=Capnocytophaga cynodegmi TaxID=28189 RepID=A0A0B7HLA8_9FLAO|nr:pentapeptide repeat-containing protein [Capnocytophaga cynodegmi]CEN39444.1 conserved membrane hypothetical protein [Capnocytophaga cynodegmi]